MKREISIFLLLIIIINFFIFNSGCKKSEPNIIKIGVIGPLTGEGATYGEAMKRGVDLAVEEINKLGGISGKIIQPSYQDSKLNPKEALNGFNYLVNVEKVQSVIGAAGSSVSLALTPVATKNKVLLISPISTADDLKIADDFFFRVIPPNTNQAKTIADFVYNKLKFREAAVFYENVDYGKNMLAEFKKYFSELGGEVIFVESYESGQKDFRNSLKKISQKEIKVIFIPGTYHENALILRQGKEIKIRSKFIGGDGAYSPELISIAGEAAEGFYLTMLGIDENSITFKDFKQSYLNKYGQDPDIYSSFSYDAAKVIIEAMKKGFLMGAEIKNYLSSIDYDGVTGKIKFDEYGDVDKPYNIFIIQNNKFELMKIDTN